MQTPDIYALEHLSNEEFWDLAFTKAFPASQERPPTYFSSDANSSSQNALVGDEVFVVCDDTYTFPLASLYEIIPIPSTMTFLSGTPHWMMGLIAWRGRILATIDLRAYLIPSTQDSPSEQERSLLIAHHDDTLLAFATAVGQTVFRTDIAYTILDAAALFNDIVQHLEKRSIDE